MYIRVSGVVAYIRELSLWSSELGQLVDKRTVVVFLYPALPIGSPRRNDDLLSIRWHSPVELGLAVNIKSFGSFSALTCR
jgi:hypothetical protein